MALGIGTDILMIRRIRSSYKDDNDAFIRKSFTEYERKQAAERSDPALFFATRFAAKEAVFKCFGVDGGNVRLTDIEIVCRESGAPEVVLHGAVLEMARQKGISGIRLSLSYDGEYAVAFALAEG